MANATKVIFLLLLFSVSGCIESRFQLAPESRLPKWFEIPNGISRDQVTVTMTQYTFGDVIFELYGENKFFNLKEVKGVASGGLRMLKKAPPGFPPDHPAYVIYNVDGENDIAEYRAPGPIFYMTDNPDIWREFNVH